MILILLKNKNKKCIYEPLIIGILGLGPTCLSPEPNLCIINCYIATTTNLKINTNQQGCNIKVASWPPPFHV